jgi:hypothetical protein
MSDQNPQNASLDSVDVATDDNVKAVPTEEKVNVEAIDKASIEVRPATRDDLPALLKTAVKVLLESKQGDFEVKGIKDKAKVIEINYAGLFNAWFEEGDFYTAADNKALLVVLPSWRRKPLKELREMIGIKATMKRYLSKEDYAQYRKNERVSAEAYNTHWRRMAAGQRRYIHLEFAVVDPSLQGSGVFRKLFQPIIDQAKADGLPVTLETHDKANVPIYEHFGFKMHLETPTKTDPSVVQYSMVKLP